MFGFFLDLLLIVPATRPKSVTFLEAIQKRSWIMIDITRTITVSRNILGVILLGLKNWGLKPAPNIKSPFDSDCIDFKRRVRFGKKLFFLFNTRILIFVFLISSTLTEINTCTNVQAPHLIDSQTKPFILSHTPVRTHTHTKVLHTNRKIKVDLKDVYFTLVTYSLINTHECWINSMFKTLWQTRNGGCW